jgi:hypothetical protein
MGLGAGVQFNYSSSNIADSSRGDFGRIEYSRSKNSAWRDNLQLSSSLDLLRYTADNHVFHFCTNEISIQTSQTLDGSDEREAFRIWRTWYRNVEEITSQSSGSDYSRMRRSSGNMSAGIGIGRLNEGRFAAVALEMVRELQNKGLLKHPPDHSQMTELTDMIYRYYNTSAPDNRVLRLESMTSILRYLSTAQIVDSVGSETPYVLEDIALYYPKYNRPFGFRVRTGIGLEWSYGKDFRVDAGTDSQQVVHYNEDSLDYRDSSLVVTAHSLGSVSSSNSIAPYIFLRGELGKPLSSTWQFGGIAQVKAYFSRSSEAPPVKSDYFDYHQVSGNSSLVHIFSTRTTGSLQIAGLYRSFREKRKLSIPEGGYYLQGSEGRQHYTELAAEVSVLYRISIPTQLLIRANYSWSDSRLAGTSSELERDNFEIGLTLSHWLL